MTGPVGFLDRKLRDRFLGRIHQSLRAKPLTLDPESHRTRLRDLMLRLGDLNFYELLQVAPGAESEEVHEAYTELARLCHPIHSERLQLVGGVAGLEILFERVTEAYLTLNDPDRSGVYQMLLGVETEEGRAPDPSERAVERRGEAARQYRIARHLEREGNYHDAVQLLQEAVRLDPQPEYYALLGECLAQNPNWLRRAAEAYSEAVELRPDDPDLRARLGLIFEKAGNKARAREQLEVALARLPGHPEASAALDRLVEKIEARPSLVKSLKLRLAQWLQE